MVFFGSHSASLLLITWWVKLMPKSFILVSLDHSTFSQIFSESFRSANLRQAGKCANDYYQILISRRVQAKSEQTFVHLSKQIECAQSIQNNVISGRNSYPEEVSEGRNVCRNKNDKLDENCVRRFHFDGLAAMPT